MLLLQLGLQDAVLEQLPHHVSPQKHYVINAHPHPPSVVWMHVPARLPRSPNGVLQL